MAPGDGKPGEASLIVDSELGELTRVSAWVLDWSESQHLPQRVARNLDLCSAEAVTNIMTHACSEGEKQRIFLHLERQGEDVVFDVENEGARFDPRLMPEPAPAASLQDARIGGWGIPIVRRFSDDLRYRHEDGRNCLTLLFRAAAPP